MLAMIQESMPVTIQTEHAGYEQGEHAGYDPGEHAGYDPGEHAGYDPGYFSCPKLIPISNCPVARASGN